MSDQQMGRRIPRYSTDRYVPPEQTEVLDVLWRTMGLSGVVWECVWCRRGAMFEFRVQRADDETDVIAVRRFGEITDDMQVCAREWLDVAVTKGFIQLDD